MRGLRTARVFIGVLAAACCAAVALPVAGVAAGTREKLPLGTACPHEQPLVLPANGVGRAAAAALAELRRVRPGHTPPDVVVESAARSAYAGDRGGEVRHQCGRLVAARTVVVQLLYPRLLPSASLSEGVVFVSRFHDGFRIWEVAH